MKKLIGSFAFAVIALSIACGSSGGPQDPQNENEGKTPTVSEAKVSTDALTHECYYGAHQRGWCCDWSNPPFNANSCTECVVPGTPCP